MQASFSGGGCNPQPLRMMGISVLGVGYPLPFAMVGHATAQVRGKCSGGTC